MTKLWSSITTYEAGIKNQLWIKAYFSLDFFLSTDLEVIHVFILSMAMLELCAFLLKSKFKVIFFTLPLEHLRCGFTFE